MKYLCDEPHWEIEGNPDFALFFSNLSGLIDGPAILAISGSSLDNNVKDYLDQIKVSPANDTRCEPHFLGPDGYHLQLTVESLDGLAQLSEHHAEPEIADHMIVYRDSNVLLEWYDAGSNPIWICREIEKERVKNFGRAVHCEIKAVNEVV